MNLSTTAPNAARGNIVVVILGAIRVSAYFAGSALDMIERIAERRWELHEQNPEEDSLGGGFARRRIRSEGVTGSIGAPDLNRNDENAAALSANTEGERRYGLGI